MNLQQSRTTSLVETTLNTASGFALSLVAQWYFLVLVKGLPMTWGDNLEFAGIMTAVSIARGFAWRRLFEKLRASYRLSAFLLAVIAERQRQIEAEGFDRAHDDAHAPGELARAAAAYLYAGSVTDHRTRHALGSWRDDSEEAPVMAALVVKELWPWEREWWKPRPDDRRRDLVRGCALGVAEGEHMERRRRRRDQPRPPDDIPPPARRDLSQARFTRDGVIDPLNAEASS